MSCFIGLARKAGVTYLLAGAPFGPWVATSGFAWQPLAYMDYVGLSKAFNRAFELHPGGVERCWIESLGPLALRFGAP